MAVKIIQMSWLINKLKKRTCLNNLYWLPGQLNLQQDDKIKPGAELTLYSTWSLVHRRRRGQSRRALTSSCRFLSTLCLWRSHWPQSGTLTWSSVDDQTTSWQLQAVQSQQTGFSYSIWGSSSLTMGCPGSENFTLISCKCLRMGSSCSWGGEKAFRKIANCYNLQGRPMLYTTRPAGGSKPWFFIASSKYCLWPIFTVSPAAVWMNLPAACHWAGPRFWKPLTRTRGCLWGLPSPRPSSLPLAWPSPSSHPGSGRHFLFKIMLAQPLFLSYIIPY